MKQRFMSMSEIQGLVSGENGIPVAFKFGDGRKVDHIFSINSTIMVF